MSSVGIHALSGDSEVCEFGEAVLIEEDVGSFDIAMDLFVFMQVEQALEDGLQDGSDFGLVEFFLGNVEQIDNAASVTVLEDNP